MAMRCSTARSVVLYMKNGMSVDAAVREAANDMRALKSGLLSRITIHAIDVKGAHKVIAVNGDGSQTYWHWESGMDAPLSRLAEPIVVHGTQTDAPSARYTRD
jgi:L-asparaginase / beta-aspartyl-peptidase